MLTFTSHNFKYVFATQFFIKNNSVLCYFILEYISNPVSCPIFRKRLKISYVSVKVVEKPRRVQIIAFCTSHCNVTKLLYLLRDIYAASVRRFLRVTVSKRLFCEWTVCETSCLYPVHLWEHKWSFNIIQSSWILEHAMSKHSFHFWFQVKTSHLFSSYFHKERAGLSPYTMFPFCYTMSGNSIIMAKQIWCFGLASCVMTIHPFISLKEEC